MQEGPAIASTSNASPAVRLDIEGPVAHIILDNPLRLNALTAAMWGAIPEIVRTVEADGAVRAVVLRGAGDRAFSAGADISEFESARTGESAVAYDALNHAAFAALAGSAKPLIAMIHGPCFGGGLALALLCDVRIADDKASFAIPAAKLGLGYHPRWIPPLLSAVPPAKAKEMIFTGRHFAAEEALDMGLVNRVVASQALDATTRALCDEIAANAPLTIRAAKRAIDDLARLGAGADLAALERLVNACFASADYAEGRRAFIEKRKPRFEGR